MALGSLMSLAPAPASSQLFFWVWWLGWSPGPRLSWHWLRIESWARRGGSSSWALRNSPCSTTGIPLHEAASVLRTPRHSGSLCPDISLPGEGRQGASGRGAVIVGTETGSGHAPGGCPPGLPETPALLGLQGCGGERTESSVARPLGNRVPRSSMCPSPLAPCGLHLVLLAPPSHSSCSCPPAVPSHLYPQSPPSRRSSHRRWLLPQLQFRLFLCFVSKKFFFKKIKVKI